VKSKATTVREYLAGLPADRRPAIEAVLRTVRAKLPKGYQESMNWGMISWEVPLSVCPDTYNKQPLAYAALGSQKNYMAIYLCNVYGIPALREELVAGFKAAGKKLDMGKSCIRFRRLEDLPLDVIGRMIAATPMASFVAFAKKVYSKRRT
jgi:uncharacterized protein YdhG (YjbR/CyaY superfamily)